MEIMPINIAAKAYLVNKVILVEIEFLVIPMIL
jgi:hypothetical protein